MRWRTTIAALPALVTLAVPVAAHAAVDAAPPSLQLPAAASFVPGTAIGAMEPDADGQPTATDDITMRVDWTASDASGICGSSTRTVYAGDAPGPWSAWTAATSMTRTATDYSDQQGGGSLTVDGYDVRVRDCSGRVTRGFVAFSPEVYQEDGSAYGYYGVSVAGTGDWLTSRCACWSGGSVTRTSVSGARADLATTLFSPHAVALVMERAPDRGAVQVLVDGEVRATVDTYAASRQHRSVVWAGEVMTAGTHTVSVVNLATPGRPRVDLDALLVSE